MTYFPDFFRNLPVLADFDPEPPVPAMSDRVLVIFTEEPEDYSAPEHVNSNEWGYVIKGRTSITIGGETVDYPAGNAFFIPEGVPHAMSHAAGTVGFTIFEDPDRFALKRTAPRAEVIPQREGRKRTREVPVFPEFLDKLARFEFPEEDGWARSLSDGGQMLLFTEPNGGSSDDLSEGAEWGLILEGQCDITVDGVTTSYRAGESYLIPGGVPNHKVNHAGLIAIDVFEKPDQFTDLVD